MRKLLPKSRSRRQHASALMLVIWAIFLMGITVAGVVRYVSFSMDESTLDAADFRCLHLAECGIVLGLHPDVRSTDPVLKQKIGTDSGFEVWLTSEGAKFPINFITDSRLQESLQNMLVTWGMSAEDAIVTVESLADWVDRDSDQRSQGAEEDYYKGFGVYDVPRNMGFTTVEEMILVRGMDRVERARPDWREYFSVYNEGTIDLRHAGKDVIMATTGAAEGNVERLISERDGEDGIHGTQDDGNLREETAFQLLGLSNDQMQAVRGNISYGGNEIRRVESIGWIGERRRKIIVIARRQEDRSMTYLGRIEE